ncbi:hypothetical protein GC098_23235 [Paenibacillus sp. LMG 31458]|uniref:Uncharacterized protein n=1 Tax=Paenibacillus phytorum TaxID=2654977 RepID=A0ABX1Y2N8_9BACL|nr:hypothetical protein [Paenibacillus phytorum]NOU74273.1 hypothetical protein [Paenibacillus phytorum]
MGWSWEENSVLNNYSPDTPCQNIFQAVCDEIGSYYSSKGFQYARSRPKITYKDQEIKLEISFWSSARNIPGDYILLEIIPSFYSIQLIRNEKVKKQKSKSNGYILGHPAIFVHALSDRNSGTVKIKQIFGEELERFERSDLDAVLKLNNACNVYGLTIEQFEKILDFIDTQIISYLDVLKNYDKLIQFIENSNKERCYYLNNSNIQEYIEITFPTMKDQIIELLNKQFI